MSRKKATKTISCLDGVRRVSEINNDEKPNKVKHVFVSGVKKNALNEDLFGRKLKINLEDQNYENEYDNDYENEHNNEYGNEFEKENEYDNENDYYEKYHETELDFDENEFEKENEYDSEIDENNQYCQNCENNQYCQNCIKTNKKISKYTKISFTLIMLILAVGLGYVISFFDGIAR